SGNVLVVHGPALHREVQLWVAAGIPPAVPLQAAAGVIRKGGDANLLLVDGNPLEEIAATERISTVFFRGERVARADLFDQQ
ncbi:MAG: hypothetical protein NTY38_32185, partial [Acidobacteria bacterium]|nr:hypothetical protein [Acidobacteriota bacterium]